MTIFGANHSVVPNMDSVLPEAQPIATPLMLDEECGIGSKLQFGSQKEGSIVNQLI